MKTIYLIAGLIVIVAAGALAYIFISGGLFSSGGGGTSSACTPNVSYVLVAYNNQYFFQNDTNYKHPNPTLYAKVGDCVQIKIIDNENVIHNYVINQLNVQSSDITAQGQTATVTFKVNQPGTYKWICSYHTDTMNGQFVVSP
ncbi:MAG: cupredoxin domain-containing protein [Thermoprotei archaeon]